MKRVIDLSHTICVGMPIYPGTEPPVIDVPCTVESHGFYERKLSFFSHTGTHLDAPAHMLAHGPTLDRMPVETFIGSAFVVQLPMKKRSTIELADLRSYENLFKSCDFFLLSTGWSKYWGQDDYFEDYPVLSEEAALWIDSFQLKGVGVDMISVDPMDSQDMMIHKILLERLVLIENLTNLDKLPESGFTFSCLPLKLIAADGSPVRAVAVF